MKDLRLRVAGPREIAAVAVILITAAAAVILASRLNLLLASGESEAALCRRVALDSVAVVIWAVVAKRAWRCHRTGRAHRLEMRIASARATAAAEAPPAVWQLASGAFDPATLAPTATGEGPAARLREIERLAAAVTSPRRAGNGFEAIALISSAVIGLIVVAAIRDGLLTPLMTHHSRFGRPDANESGRLLILALATCLCIEAAFLSDVALRRRRRFRDWLVKSLRREGSFWRGPEAEELALPEPAPTAAPALPGTPTPWLGVFLMALALCIVVLSDLPWPRSLTALGITATTVSGLVVFAPLLRTSIFRGVDDYWQRKLLDRQQAAARWLNARLEPIATALRVASTCSAFAFVVIASDGQSASGGGSSTVLELLGSAFLLLLLLSFFVSSLLGSWTPPARGARVTAPQLANLLRNRRTLWLGGGLFLIGNAMQLGALFFE